MICAIVNASERWLKIAILNSVWFGLADDDDNDDKGGNMVTVDLYSAIGSENDGCNSKITSKEAKFSIPFHYNDDDEDDDEDHV